MGGVRGTCEKKKYAYRFQWGGNMVERDRLDDLDTDGRIIFT